MSLVMALNEHCPSAWHMLIERLILWIILLKVVYRWVLDDRPTLKRRKNSSMKKGQILRVKRFTVKIKKKKIKVKQFTFK